MCLASTYISVFTHSSRQELVLHAWNRGIANMNWLWWRETLVDLIKNTHRRVERDSGACWEILRLKECLTTIEGRSAVDVSSHEGWLCLLSHRVVPHSTNSALKQVNEVTEMLNGIEQHSINSNAVGVHVCHLSVYCCMTCLAASVVAVVGTQGRILQWSMRARSRGATATVRMTQALTVLLMHLKHIALALTHAD